MFLLTFSEFYKMLDAFFHGAVCLQVAYFICSFWHFILSVSVSILFTECWENNFELFGSNVTLHSELKPSSLSSYVFAAINAIKYCLGMSL